MSKEVVEDAIVEDNSMLFVINWDKIKTVKQIAKVFKALQLTVQTNVEGQLDQSYKEIYEDGLMLREVKQEDQE